ncbi:MAG: hypothetical protein AAF619_08825 [Pseudomonadota bacterium]
MRKTFLLSLVIAAVLVLPPAKADDLATAEPCSTDQSCTYSWSLASRLGQALVFTEARYGIRDRTWTLLGVEFVEPGGPSVWFPNYGAGGRNVIVQLTPETRVDEKRALFQIGHEVVHVLEPGGPPGEATVFEEGLATLNSLDFVTAQGIAIDESYIADRRYLAAFQAVNRIVEAEGRSALERSVRALRDQTGDLSPLTPEDLTRVFQSVSPEDAITLAAPFSKVN